MDFVSLLDHLRTSGDNQRFQLISHLSVSSVPSLSHFQQLLAVISDFLEDDICLEIEIVGLLRKLMQVHGPVIEAIGMLETLVQADDSVIRKEAALGLAELIGTAGDEVVLGICRRLGSAQFFMQKIGLPKLIAFSFPHFSPAGQQEAYHCAETLVNDPVMAVRKSAVESLSLLVENVPDQYRDFLLTLLVQASNDTEDMIRMLAVQAIAQFSSRFRDESLKPTIVKLINVYGNDNAWKVRHQLATYITVLAQTFGTATAIDVLAPIYAQLLQDEEAEVRNAACCNLASFCDLLGPDTVAQQILPVILRLTTDLEFVRVTFASQINKLCPIVGEQNTKLFLLEAMLELLRGDSAEIRIPLLKELESVKHVIGEESLAENIMPALAELTNNRQWRVRQQIVELMPTFARQLGEEFFTTHFVRVLCALVEDPVFTVREATIDVLLPLTDLFGAQWTQTYLLPLVLDTRNRESYLHRLTALLGIGKLASKLAPETVASELVPIVRQMVSDPVPNIRMNVAKVCWSLQKTLSDRTSLQDLLQILSRDPDFDVRYMSERPR